MTPDHATGARPVLRRSLFFKLILIYLGTTVVLVMTVGAVMRLAFERPPLLETALGKHLQKYIELLTHELGDPPQRDRALLLARELGMGIRVSTSAGAWQTDVSFPEEAVLIDNASDLQQGRYVGRYAGRFFVILDRETWRYTFLFQQDPFRRGSRRPFVWLMALIVLLLGGSYVVVRWLFRPIFWLNEGVQEIAKGNLAHQVPVRSGDELGHLTSSFNRMTTQVRQMMRAREQLLLDVSHELRSPVTRMKVALEFVQEESVKTQLQHEVRELETMVTELLESERLSSDHGGLRRTEADLAALARDVGSAYQGRQPGVWFTLAPEPLPVNLDVERVRIALRNLIENALKYSPATGPPVEIRVQRDATSVSVSIRDYGPGISPEEQRRVFEPFYRVDKSRGRDTGGYGLGLSLVKTIMVAHGGDILVVSEPGQGSTFTLRFPA
jgi:signal transduction histidine kinase